MSLSINKISGIFFVYFLLVNNGIAQLNLTIDVIEIRNDKGRIMLQLLDETEKIIWQEMSPIKNNTCSFLISDLKPGRYAIRYYHDENQNGKMDTNSIGKPTEGYGFSNNVMGKFGPPAFEKWLFDISFDKKIFLKPNY
jgi:uncharacterized protein (DUF2141 family)